MSLYDMPCFLLSIYHVHITPNHSNYSNIVLHLFHRTFNHNSLPTLIPCPPNSPISPLFIPIGYQFPSIYISLSIALPIVPIISLPISFHISLHMSHHISLPISHYISILISLHIALPLFLPISFPISLIYNTLYPLFIHSARTPQLTEATVIGKIGANAVPLVELDSDNGTGIAFLRRTVAPSAAMYSTRLRTVLCRNVRVSGVRVWRNSRDAYSFTNDMRI